MTTRHHHLARAISLPVAASILALGAGLGLSTPASAAPCLTCTGGDGGPAPRPTPAPPTAATPTTPVVSNVSWNSATLTWTDPAKDESSFTVTRSSQATPASPISTSQVTVPANGATTYTLTQNDLPSTQTVWWTVVANAASKASSSPAVAGTLTVALPSAGPALPQLQGFRADWTAGAFPNVGKAAVLADLVGIVADPMHNVNQGYTGACGPTTAELELANRDPGRYVGSVRAIADNGGFTTPDGTTYAASSDLRNSPVHSGITPANWLFLATLKDSINLTARITASTSPDDAAWISSPADVDNWLAHVVGLENTTATAILRPFTYGETVMPGASALLPGSAVVLLIDSSLVGNPPGPFSVPDHYVDLRSWSANSSTVTFTVETWGQLKTISTDWNTFDGLTWDVLTAS